LRDNGAAFQDVLATFESMLAAAAQAAGAPAQEATLTEALRTAREALALVNATGTAFVALGASAPAAAYAVSVPFLKLCGLVFSTTLLVHGALSAAADTTDHDFCAAKLQTMRFHLRHCLPQAQSLAQIVRLGGDCVVSARTELI
jgi:hypothetical protein